MNETELFIEVDKHSDVLTRCKSIHSEIRPTFVDLSTDEYVNYMHRSKSIHLVVIMRKNSSEEKILALATYRTFLTTYDGVRFKIEDLIVDKTERKQGFGTRILHWLIEKAKELGSTKILVQCPPTNHGAQRFFFRLGLTILLYEFESEKNEVFSNDDRFEVIHIDQYDEKQRREWLKKIHQVHRQLRAHLPTETEDYIHLMEQILQQGPAQLIVVVDVNNHEDILGLAVYRICDYFEHLYCDDLVTNEQKRSLGVGRLLINTMKIKCKEFNVNRFLLDSGCQRGDAHRFYTREYLRINQFGFSKMITI